MVDMQADTIGHVLAAVLTGVAIPFCDFSPELWGHELSLILAVILGKVALESLSRRAARESLPAHRKTWFPDLSVTVTV